MLRVSSAPWKMMKKQKAEGAMAAYHAKADSAGKHTGFLSVMWQTSLSCTAIASSENP